LAAFGQLGWWNARYSRNVAKAINVTLSPGDKHTLPLVRRFFAATLIAPAMVNPELDLENDRDTFDASNSSSSWVCA
jgi:sulfur relay (sulfurtransferase) DsrC/TusE family protein